MVLRPLALQIIAQDSRDLSSQWYLTDGREYKVKLLQGAEVQGPKELELFKAKRADCVSRLADANAL
jgi:hypothetical protein